MAVKALVRRRGLATGRRGAAAWRHRSTSLDPCESRGQRGRAGSRHVLPALRDRADADWGRRVQDVSTQVDLHLLEARPVDLGGRDRLRQRDPSLRHLEREDVRLDGLVQTVDECINDVGTAEQTVQAVTQALDAITERPGGLLLLLARRDDLRVRLVQLVRGGVLCSSQLTPSP